jgi:hypothetical protein
MIRPLHSLVAVIAPVVMAVMSTPARAEDVEPEHFRGVITKADGSSLVMKTAAGNTVRLALPDDLLVIALTKASFTDVDYGTYVGSVAVRLDEYSPIVRDSLSWLHKGFELRIVDEQLRGIALGHKGWDLTPESIIAHGWVDDMEVRVISIKYGPTEQEETDVDIPRDVPILRMSLGDRGLLKPGTHVCAGAQKGADGRYAAVFVFAGADGIVPSL